MAALVEDVANMALALLDEAPIASLEDNVKAARLIRLHFDQTREAELSKYAWNFAIFSAEIPGYELASGETEYALPADCLRVMSINDRGIEIEWRLEGASLICPTSGTRTVRYVANVVDPNEWDAVFIEVMCAALAIKLALPLTHKAGMIQAARSAYTDALAVARRTNAIQREVRKGFVSWVAARGDDRGAGL